MGTPDELRRQAFDGEFVQLVLGGTPGNLGKHLCTLEKVGRVAKARENEEAGEAVCSVWLVVEDADVALPKLNVLDGADVRDVWRRSRVPCPQWAPDPSSLVKRLTNPVLSWVESLFGTQRASHHPPLEGSSWT